MSTDRPNRSRRGVVGFALVSATIFAPRVGLAQLGWSPNRANNTSFEDQMDWWNPRVGAQQPGDAVESVIHIDSSIAHRGVYSLKLSGDDKTTKWWAIESEPLPATPGKRYKFGGWMKAKDVKPVDGQYVNANVYIQFRDEDGVVIPMGKSPVRSTQPLTGTRDWIDLYAVVAAPEGAVQARIGCALTCSGTVWFDDVYLYESEQIAWAVRRTDHFFYMYTQGDVPKDDVLEANDRFVERLKKLLEIEPEGPHLRYFKYKSTLDKRQLMAHDENLRREDAIHSVRWTDLRGVVPRLMRTLGASTEVLTDGITEYAMSKLDGKDVHDKARELAKSGMLPELSGFLDPGSITIVPKPVRRATFGSFVGWLVEAQSMERFREVYGFEDAAAAARDLPKRFKETYGMSLDDAEKAWRKFLKGE